VGKRPEENEVPLSVRAVAEWEKRVFAQRRLIADLKRSGEPITKAENKLKQYQAFLNQLRIHREIIEELMTPGAYPQISPVKGPILDL
jgi:hypothetical protein